MRSALLSTQSASPATPYSDPKPISILPRGLSQNAGFDNMVRFPYFADSQEAYHPFGMGPHGCLGQQLCWVKLRVILARLLWNFNVEVLAAVRVDGTEVF